MEITQRIFDLLKARHKSKAELARYLGIRPTTVTEWDTKGKKPSVEYISRISEFLGVSCDYLLTGKETISKATTIEMPKTFLSENEEEMLELFSQLTEHQQSKLIGRIEYMVEENQKNNLQENVG